MIVRPNIPNIQKNLIENIWYLTNYLPGSNLGYSVSIHIDSIWMTPNSIWQTEYRSYLDGGTYPG